MYVSGVFLAPLLDFDTCEKIGLLWIIVEQPCTIEVARPDDLWTRLDSLQDCVLVICGPGPRAQKGGITHRARTECRSSSSSSAAVIGYAMTLESNDF